MIACREGILAWPPEKTFFRGLAGPLRIMTHKDLLIQILASERCSKMISTSDARQLSEAFLQKNRIFLHFFSPIQARDTLASFIQENFCPYSRTVNLEPWLSAEVPLSGYSRSACELFLAFADDQRLRRRDRMRDLVRRLPLKPLKTAVFYVPGKRHPYHRLRPFPEKIWLLPPRRTVFLRRLNDRRPHLVFRAST